LAGAAEATLKSCQSIIPSTLLGKGSRSYFPGGLLYITSHGNLLSKTNHAEFVLLSIHVLVKLTIFIAVEIEITLIIGSSFPNAQNIPSLQKDQSAYT
jgi:hypothetical protein